jgi:HK97 family phage major capsid protein
MSKMTIKDLTSAIREAVGAELAERAEASRRKATEHRAPAFASLAGAPARRGLYGRGVVLKEDQDPMELSAKDRGSLAARCVLAAIATRGNLPQALEMLREMDGGVHTPVADIWERALGTDVFASGGAAIPPEFASGIIEVLRGKSVVRKMGPTVGPVTALSYFSAGSSAQYVGQNTNLPKTEPTTGTITMTERTLGAVLPYNNDFLRRGGPAVEAKVREDLVRAMAVKEDQAFIRSDGTTGEPRGLLYWAITANKFNANATVNLDNVTKDLTTAIARLQNGNVPVDEAAWLLAPRSKLFLMGLRDSSSSGFGFKDEMATGKLLGFPFFDTTHIPINLGGGSDESEVYFVQAPSMYLGEDETMEVESFSGGAYHDGSAVVSGISQNQTVLKAIAHHDLVAQQRGAEIAVIQAVKWL